MVSSTAMSRLAISWKTAASCAPASGETAVPRHEICRNTCVAPADSGVKPWVRTSSSSGPSEPVMV